MKTIAFRLISLLAIAASITATAQNNIKSAFDAIINCPDAEISESHYSSKDTSTKLKSGQDDIYNFVLPANKINLIKKAVEAFEKDDASAYMLKRGRNSGSKSENFIYSQDLGTFTIDDTGREYIYAFFTPSKAEDPKNIHRYAYALNYKEVDGKIYGKIVINYATTSDYRNQQERQRQIDWTIQMSKSNRESADSDMVQTWFEKVMACLNGLQEATPKTRIALATKTYKLVSGMNEYDDVTNQDKETIKRVLRILLVDQSYQDPVLIELLKECQAAIK